MPPMRICGCRFLVVTNRKGLCVVPYKFWQETPVCSNNEFGRCPNGRDFDFRVHTHWNCIRFAIRLTTLSLSLFLSAFARFSMCVARENEGAPG